MSEVRGQRSVVRGQRSDVRDLSSDYRPLTADFRPLTSDLRPLTSESRRRIRRPMARETGPIDVSVCIANWNCCDMLRGCLESLLDQPQGVSLEVIVVDNGSTDGTPAMV